METHAYLAYAAPISVIGTKWENPASISDDIKVDIFKKYSNLTIITNNGENQETKLWVALSHTVKHTDDFTGPLEINVDKLAVDANDMLGLAEFDRLAKETGIVQGRLRWTLIAAF